MGAVLVVAVVVPTKDSLIRSPLQFRQQCVTLGAFFVMKKSTAGGHSHESQGDVAARVLMCAECVLSRVKRVRAQSLRCHRNSASTHEAVIPSSARVACLDQSRGLNVDFLRL